MLIIKRADGTRIAIETETISAIEEAPAPNHLTQSIVYCGTHRHTIDAPFDQVLAAIAEHDNAQYVEDEPEDNPDALIEGETAIDAHGEETKTN